MTAPTDRSLTDLLALGDRIVAMATKGGATVAECVLRSGAELSAKVRMGQPELVASVIALGSWMPDFFASSNQRVNCAIGSGSTSASERPASS